MPAVTTAGTTVLPHTELYGRVSEFFNVEADLLDTYRFAEWLERFTEDVSYRMPVRTTQFLTDGEGFHDFDFFVDDHATLYTRVKRLETEFAWAETPPSRTRHFVSNLRVWQDGEEIRTQCNFMITRTRQDLEYQLFTGVRHDVLVSVGDAFQIRERRIYVDQTVITATNLSVLF